MGFEEFGLEDGILRAVRKVGYERPTPVQAAAIPKIMRGEDLTAIAQTGTGKTAAFVLPLLHRLSLCKKANQLQGTYALILAPTRELAVQITENVHSYGRHFSIRIAAIYGGVDENAQIRAARKGANIIVATPGRLIDLLERHKLDFSRLQIFVLDEADRMLHMGFLPDLETIVSHLPKHRQTLMFSATFPKEVESLAKRFQYQAKRVQVGALCNPADTVKQSIYEVSPHLKAAMLLALLKDDHFSRVLVFVRLKETANRLSDFLRKEKISLCKLHSSRTQEQRLKALENFKKGEVRVMIATDLAARGIDIDGVSHVINYDFPVNPEDYIHRIGRTGRAEQEGQAISLVPKGDLNLLGILEMAIAQRIPRKRLHGFDYYAKSQGLELNSLKKDWRKRTREGDKISQKNEVSKPKAKKAAQNNKFPKSS